MRKSALILLSAAALYSVPGCTRKNVPQSSTNGNVVSDDDQVYTFVEQMPAFPGGESALLAYLNNEIKYPKEARKNNEQGRVMLRFVVRKDGSITEPEVVRSVSESIDKEALRVIKAMPKWTPGKQNGQPVSVHYTMPVVFKYE